VKRFSEKMRVKIKDYRSASQATAPQKGKARLKAGLFLIVK